MLKYLPSTELPILFQKFYAYIIDTFLLTICTSANILYGPAVIHTDVMTVVIFSLQTTRTDRLDNNKKEIHVC